MYASDHVHSDSCITTQFVKHPPGQSRENCGNATLQRRMLRFVWKLHHKHQRSSCHEAKDEPESHMIRDGGFFSNNWHAGEGCSKRNRG